MIRTVALQTAAAVLCAALIVVLLAAGEAPAAARYAGGVDLALASTPAPLAIGTAMPLA
jgi:hypothetical protein